ncbi:MAG TPA: GNAT family protein [Thermoplasmata archaeon]|jgi:RimJ/RimL family protein N-acetyltransferase
MESFRTPVTLTGRWIRLVPLARSHATALRAAAQDPEIGKYLIHGPGETQEEIESLISLLLERQKAGTDLPFTTVLRADGRPVGMTRYLHVDRTNLSVEVGGTWLDSALWRTPVNTESKFLLFRHAFETEKVHRVSLRTDLRNERAQRAIARLGAVREAVFRDDRLLADGSFRSSVVYGILASEWPRVRDGLETMLAHDWNPPELRGPTTPPGDPATDPKR